jgi:hypothetical protein
MDTNNDNPQKIKKERDIHCIQKETPIKWSDIKNLNLEDDDLLQIGHDEGYYAENNSWDPHYFAIVTRMVEETDEQRDERVRMAKWHKGELEKRRYENYLKLKKEFESNDSGAGFRGQEQ